MERVYRYGRLPFAIIGLILFFVGERYLYGESYFTGVRSAAILLMLIAAVCPLGLAGIAKRHGFSGESQSWKAALTWHFALVFASVLYVVYSKALGAEAVPQNAMHKFLLGSWVLAYIVAIALFVGTELSLSEGALGVHAEPDRVRRARISWATIGVMTAFLVCVNYVGSRKDKVWDWSYLKATDPSPGTKAMVGGLAEDLKIAVFFPQDNEVLPFVKDYFGRLRGFSSRITIEYFDKDLEPAKSEDLKVTKNGTVVVTRGAKQEKIVLGTTIRSARKALSQLDEKFQGAFKGLDVADKVIYFTRGHGELSWQGDDEDPTRKITMIEAWLRNQNYRIKTLDITSGSTKEIASKDSLIIIAGPTKPFLKEEIDRLREFLEKGGRMLALLDIEGDKSDVAVESNTADPLRDLIKETGVTFEQIPLANVANRVSVTKTKLDNWFLFTNSFGTHESISGLSHHDEKVAIIALRAGSLVISSRSGQWAAVETVRSLPDTFQDLNKNQDFDAPDEKKKAYSMGAASTYKGAGEEGRVLTFADASLLSDAVIRNPGNILFAAGAISWLIGKPDAAVVANNEEDIKIQHSRKEDTLIFYGSVAFMPFMVLAIGAVKNRRGPRKKKKGE